MPDSSNFSTVGNPRSNFSIANTVTNFSGRLKNNNKRNFRYRVTGVFFDKKGNCTHITYEDTFQNYGQSSLGKIEKNSIAYTSNAGAQNIPFVGEYVDLFNAAEAYSAAVSKASPGPTTYWNSTKGSLNIWNTFEGDNINLDPTVPSQVVDTQMTSLNVGNYNKSLIGIVPRQIEETQMSEISRARKILELNGKIIELQRTLDNNSLNLLSKDKILIQSRIEILSKEIKELNK